MTAPDDWHALYPFQSHEAILDGHRCHYVDEGAGPVLLMVHGNPTWSFYWREFIKALRDRYRVVAIDHIGCGLSDKPAAKDRRSNNCRKSSTHHAPRNEVHHAE